MQSHGTTTFPLLETVMVKTGTTVSADGSANSGATLKFDSTGNLKNDKYQLAVPGIGLDAAMTAGGFYCYTLVCGSSNGGFVELNGLSPYASNLSWTTYGVWDAGNSTAFRFASFATGYITPVANIPTTGSATFTGETRGVVSTPSGECVCLFGNAALQANFGTGNITGNLTNMNVAGAPWNNVSLTGTMASGVNAFSGTTGVTSAPPGEWTLNNSASGTFVGRFFGPNAEELGAVWTLYDGTKAATGSLGAKRP